ncbi:MAG TPA: NIPSNAP family protein [Terriglobia bacterium]|nr:NIPSNAP family protein [Terriglobia bacterium]
MSSSYFEFYYVHMQNGSQTARMSKWLETRLMPICQKHGFGPLGFFTVTVGRDLPTTLIIFSYPSLADMEALWGKLNADPDYAAAVAEPEKDEPAFYRTEATLLRATSFSPPFAATPAGDPTHKLYELRIYESPTNRQLGYLHDRFGRDGEIEIFHKSGIHPILYANTIFGPNLPNLAYLIPFESEAQREKAWATFNANPDWVRIRAESVQHGGEIVRNITNLFLTPMSFSMLR